MGLNDMRMAPWTTWLGSCAWSSSDLWFPKGRVESKCLHPNELESEDTVAIGGRLASAWLRRGVRREEGVGVVPMVTTSSSSLDAPFKGSCRPEERLARLAQLLPAAMVQVWWDGRRKLEIRSSSTAVSPLLGLEASDACQAPSALLARVVPGDRRQILRAFVKARRSNGNVRCRFRIRGTNSSNDWREIVASPSEEGGDAGTWWCWVRDLELGGSEFLQDASLGSDRSGGHLSLLTRVSHELRTPLNGVLGFAQLLRANAGRPQRNQERYLACIEFAAQHLCAVVDDLVDLPRIQAGTLVVELGPVPVWDTVEEALAMVEPAAKQAQVELVVNGGKLVTFAHANRLRLRQILLNLLTNAIKYNRRGQEVRVSWTQDPAAGTVRLAISDRGRGLRPDQIDCLFEPFNRLGAERTGVEGVGIGLVIARGLARMMGGDIEVASQIDSGSTFSVVLPTAPCSP
jgi:signal transduction histidine kinase